MSRSPARIVLEILVLWVFIYLLSKALDVLPGWVGSVLFFGVLAAVLYFIARSLKRGRQAWSDLHRPEGKIIEGEIVKDTKKVK